MVKMQTPKGTRDLLAADKILKNNLLAALKVNFEEFGFDPIETPGIEMLDILSSKYAGGSEILKEVYKLTDQGGRKLALRYDHTVPMARVIASNPHLPMPFKRFAMGPVWRDGPVKTGRLREFWQCDGDIVGASSMAADAEIISLIVRAFKRLDFDVVVKVNNRKVLNAVVKEAGVPAGKVDSTILSIDKLAKVGLVGVQKELKSKKISQKAIDKISDVLSLDINKDNLDALKTLLSSAEASEGIAELKEVFGLVDAVLLGDSVEYDISLARGLSYYTGSVFEAFLKNSKMKSAVAAGGRWDNIIGNFLGSKDVVPAIGVSFGLDAIIEALRADGDSQELKTITRVLVVPIKTLEKCFPIAMAFRESGIPTEVDLMGRGLKKNLNFANKQGIPFVIIVGEKELSAGNVTLRDMVSGEQKEISLEEALKRVV